MHTSEDPLLPVVGQVHYSALDEEKQQQQQQQQRPWLTEKKVKKKSICWLTIMMCSLVAMGCMNFILVKAMYDAFGTRGAFFANQGVNLLYVVYGGSILGYKIMCTKVISTSEDKKFPQSRFFGLATLDAFGTFFTAMGATFTPLALQQILNQTLIPLTMICSFFFLRTRFRLQAVCGAILIFLGAAVVILGSLEGSSSGEHFRWYASAIYFLSNVPMALSATYKEIAFKDQTVDVWYLCFWVSLYQFLVSFVFIPLLGLPFISGSANPPPLSQLPSQFLDGALCWVGAGPCCCTESGKIPSNTTALLNISSSAILNQQCLQNSESLCPTPLGPALWLLPGYTLCNFIYNALGLYITKHGSAVLRYISYALILPLATMAGASVFQEKITIYTIIGLVTVVVGFGLYQKYHALQKFDGPASNDNGVLDEDGSVGGGYMPDLGSMPSSGGNWFRDSLEADVNPFLIGSPKYVQWKKMKKKQASFQERVIGLGLAFPNDDHNGGVNSCNNRRIIQREVGSDRGRSGSNLRPRSNSK